MPDLPRIDHPSTVIDADGHILEIMAVAHLMPGGIKVRIDIRFTAHFWLLPCVVPVGIKY